MLKDYLLLSCRHLCLLSNPHQEDEMYSYSIRLHQDPSSLSAPSLYRSQPYGAFCIPSLSNHLSLRSCCYILEISQCLLEKCPCLFGTPHVPPAFTCTGGWASSVFYKYTTDATSPQGLSRFSWTNRKCRAYALLGKTPKMSAVKMQFFFSHCKREWISLLGASCFRLENCQLDLPGAGDRVSL